MRKLQNPLRHKKFAGLLAVAVMIGGCAASLTWAGSDRDASIYFWWAKLAVSTGNNNFRLNDNFRPAHQVVEIVERDPRLHARAKMMGGLCVLSFVGGLSVVAAGFLARQGASK
jgi:hypothetical protein